MKPSILSPSAHVVIAQFEVEGAAMVSTEKAARILGVGRDFLDDLCDENLIEYIKAGRSRRMFRPEHLLAWLDNPRPPARMVDEKNGPKKCRSTSDQTRLGGGANSPSTVSDFAAARARRRAERRKK